MRFAALLVVLLGCDMALPKQIVSYPITGTLDTKKGPLCISPGSFLQLDNVRQERADEWRNRQGVTHDDVLDDAEMFRVADLPGGGLFGLAPVIGAGNAGNAYSREVPATASRWSNLIAACSQVTPSHWKRKQIGTAVYRPYVPTIAIGNGLRMVAWKPGTTAIGEDAIRVVIVSNEDGKVVTFEAAIGGVTGKHPKAVYDSASNMFLLFWLEGTNVQVARWTATTGAVSAVATTLKNNAVAAGFLDAIHYTGANITVVYNQTGGNAHQLEVVPSSLALATDADLLVNADNALALLPDPDSSAVRFVALSTAVPEVRVLRCTAAGAVTTNTLADAGILTGFANQISGVAYQAGASWMIVYNSFTAAGFPALHAIKLYSGALGARYMIAGGHTGTIYKLNSNAWREQGVDAMRYIAGIHVDLVGSVAPDFQASYFEMALEYNTGSSTITNRYTEPQARMIPLNAGPVHPQGNALVQVVANGTKKYALALTRIAQPIIASGAVENLYAVDTWDQEILAATTFSDWPNLGPSHGGQQAGYIPAGLLLQSTRGALIHGHGASGLPFRPAGTLAAFVGGLTAAQTYSLGVTIEMHDDGGNLWRSPMSVVSSTVTPTVGNTQVDWAIRLPSFENHQRLRTVKLWRTLGNGTEYRLLHQRTLTCDPTNSVFTYADTTTDALLAAGSNFLPVGLPASITPPFSHVTEFDGRLWGVNRDFPNRLHFSKVIQNGIAPEFPLEFFRDINDGNGEITGIAPADDKLIVLQTGGVKWIGAGGPNDDGSGQQYRALTVTTEVGSASGAPYLSIGSAVWFFHDGVYRVSRSLEVEHVGQGIDKWFNQPLLQTAETPLSMTYNDRRDEIRLLTTNYRFVYDMAHGCWIRDTFPQLDPDPPALYNLFMHTLPGVGDMFFRHNAQVWWDYDTESLGSSADASGDIEGEIRSPWLRLAKPEGFIRLSRTRTLWAREPAAATGNWPTTTTYFNDDDAINESDAPQGTTGTTKQTIETRTVRMKCTSFSTKLTLPAGDLRWRLSQWSWLIQVKKSMHMTSPVARGRSTVAVPPPDDIVYWFEADNEVTLGVGANVATWGDKTINNRNVASGVVGFPQYDADGWAPGVPALFSTDSVRMNYTFANVFDQGDPRTVIAVIRPATDAGNIGGYIAAFRRSDRDYAVGVYTPSPGPTQFFYTNCVDGANNIIAVTPVDYTGQDLLFVSEFNGTTITTKINGVTIAVTQSTAGGEDGVDAGFSLFGISCSNIASFRGHAAAVMCYARSTAPANALAYLQNKYGVG